MAIPEGRRLAPFLLIRKTALQVAMLLACTAAYANEPQEKAEAAANAVQTITVRTTRDPVDKSYRKMLNGMELFEKQRSLAPNASLRFKLLPRQRDTNMDGIVLNIVGDSVTIPVPVGSDRTFTLARHRKALDEDASVMPNRKADSMTWRTDIRTPGLPPNTRRLGDLRLECQVGMEADLISNVLPVIGQIANFIQRMLDYCNSTSSRYLFFSERPLFGVTLVAGTRREALSVDELYAGASYGLTAKADLAHCDCEVLLDRAYFLPLGDRSWPDDTRIELEYMDDESDRPATPTRPRTVVSHSATDAVTVGKSSKAEVMAALGRAAIVNFDSGFEVWVYHTSGDTPAKESWVERAARNGSDKGTQDKPEFVVLLDPSGVVRKTRLREAPPLSEARGK